MPSAGSTGYAKWLQEQSEETQAMLNAYFSSIQRHLMLPRKERSRLLHDFRAALMVLLRRGKTPEEACRLLPPERLGGFYARPATQWYALDDAAKIYPLSVKHGRMSMFRLSADLNAEVVPELLQAALDYTVRRFPGFATTLKRGFFWHYLSATKVHYAVEPETDLPVRPIRVRSSGSHTFRVLYWEKRISVEFFHILTDASGGLIFLKTLLAEYLRLTGVAVPAVSGVLDIEEAPSPEENANLFPICDRKMQGGGLTDKAALQLGGRLSPIRPARIVQFRMPSESLREVARGYGATVTEYLLGIILLACRHASDETEGDFSVQVPVNMRKYYPAKTLRNFSMYAGIRLPAGQVDTLPHILPEIRRQLREKTAIGPMTAMIHSSALIVRGVRWIPMFIKGPIAGALYGFLGDRVFTTTLSNLGVIELPSEMEEQLDSMSFILGTTVTNRSGCALITCGGTAMLSVTKLTRDPAFEEAMYRLLTGDGVTVSAEGSMPYDD